MRLIAVIRSALPLAAVSAASKPNDHVVYDIVERVVTYEQVQVIWDQVGVASQFHPNSHNETGGDLDARDALTARGALDVLLNGRQSCNTGYAYCNCKKTPCPAPAISFQEANSATPF